jgi:phage terminase large subunit-like protein
MRDVIEVITRGSIYRVLSAEAYSKEGLNISRAIVDELHAHQSDELWNVLRNGTGGRIEPLICAITTAGVMTDMTGNESVCYRMFRYAVEVATGLREDPTFFFAWWGAPQGADHLDPEVWRRANPGYGDILNPEDLEVLSRTTPENEFRTKRLNQWVPAASVWLPSGAWAAVADATVTIPDGADCVLAFDGSYNGDCTALTLVSVGDKPHITLIELWEPSLDRSQVDVLEVEEKIRATCRRYHVLEIAADPYRWERSLQILADEGLPVVTFPQNPARMTPATTRFYEAVMNGQLTHNGDPRLARHVANCILKVDSRGSRLAKDAKKSVHRIDAAVTAVMAFNRAANLESEPVPWVEFV